MKKIPWSSPEIGSEEQDAMINVIKSGWLTEGKETELFEKELADYFGAKHVVAVNNGTSALISAMIAEGVKAGDEVITPAFTFVATINSIISIGAKPVLIDCDADNFNITIDLVKEKINEKTKAIMLVDVAGLPCDLDAFEKLAKEYNLILIEDAAEAIGAEYKNKKVGGFNHTSIFSFHMAKDVTTIEGGCVCTNDGEINRKLRMIKNHGMQKRYDYGFFGLNLRTTDIQSALGRAQLKKINKFLETKNRLADKYKKGLKNCCFQQIPDYATKHPYMLFGVLVDKNIRDSFIKHLNDNGVDTRICWPSIFKQDYHSQIFSAGGSLNSEKIASEIINLPIGNGLSDEDADYVIEVFNNFKN